MAKGYSWSGRRVTEARKVVATWLPMPCGKCGEQVDRDPWLSWVIGHKLSRSTHPELTWEPSNWHPEHRRCSDASGQSGVIEKAKADALRAAGFPASTPPGQTPPLPRSLSRAPQAPVSVRPELSWAKHVQGAPTWLLPLLSVPQDASPPLAMTGQHPDAVGSYGWDAVCWIQDELGLELRWWQQLAIVRQLEHDLAGRLVWRNVVESCPRRAGKSVRIRGLALWRLAHADLIGEIQTVVHTGSDLPICREIQRGAWRWADAKGWTVMRSNGKEAIEADDGSRWIVRSQDGVYGWDAGLAVVDESWDVKPDTVSEGLEPAMLERCWPQLHLTSTAHRRATSLMRQRISSALAQDDGETLLLLWSALPQDDPSDPATWRKASPHWSPERERMIAAKYTAALAGEADPELDDPDPMAGFVAQYLNVWQLKQRKAVAGDSVVSAEAWQQLAQPRPAGLPDAVAVESHFDDGVSVAYAWRSGSQVLVSVADHATLQGAAQAIRSSGYSRRVLVGESIQKDPAWRGLATRPMRSPTRSSVADLSRLLAEQALLHDGSEHLADQALALRTSPGADGPRLRSTGRADAVKAAVWAASSLRSVGVGKPRIIVAS